MPTYRTAQTYDVYSANKEDFFGRFTSLTKAREKARFLATTYMGRYRDMIVIKNPKIMSDGSLRPAFQLITVTCEMFIRPTYDFKYFGREAILRNDRPTGTYKYYLIDKNGNIAMTDDNFKKYFDHSHVKSGVWERPRK